MAPFMSLTGRNEQSESAESHKSSESSRRRLSKFRQAIVNLLS
jgi:hypothetical protein